MADKMESEIPNWLPDIIELEDYDGNYHNYIEALYEIFKQDFLESEMRFQDKIIAVPSKIGDSGKNERFDHITSETDSTTGERLLALRRCERLCWVKPVIENLETTDTKVLIWEKPKSNSDIRVNIFLPELDFIIVLRKMRNHYVFITMIHPVFPSQKQKYLKEYEKYK